MIFVWGGVGLFTNFTKAALEKVAATSGTGETRLTQNFRIGYNFETAYVGGVHYAWSIGREVGDTEKSLRIHTFFQKVSLLALLVVGFFPYVSSRTDGMLVGAFIHKIVGFWTFDFELINVSWLSKKLLCGFSARVDSRCTMSPGGAHPVHPVVSKH